ncbi:MAG TPA: thioredoxin domain-containing protein [Gemmatimonadaceae bacterium]|nr:thioredoxin domain-containing protein [Gemmatimonadaceae bacterium]
MVSKQRGNSSQRFYMVLALVVVAGGLLIVRAARAPRARANVTTAPITAAQAEGYLLGNPNAPVQILEFADFECPACGNFSVITEPDVRARIVNTGLASYRFFDFPLPMHKNTIAASNAAACAADQGKFWEMHDALFRNQPEWNGEATDNPKKVFVGYVKTLGINSDSWEKCFDAQTHQPRIMANQAEGVRRNVQSTPTFVIGTRVIPGGMSYDVIKAYVDSATKEAPVVAKADTTAAKSKTK